MANRLRWRSVPAARAEGVAWDAAAIRSHAEQFGERRFLEGLRAEIGRVMEGAGR